MERVVNDEVEREYRSLDFDKELEELELRDISDYLTIPYSPKEKGQPWRAIQFIAQVVIVGMGPPFVVIGILAYIAWLAT